MMWKLHPLSYHITVHKAKEEDTIVVIFNAIVHNVFNQIFNSTLNTQRKQVSHTLQMFI